MSIELLIILPLLLWAYMGTFVFFDGFRAHSTNVKTTYTIADILSREVNEPITPAYLDRLYQLQGFLADAPQPRILRVTTLRYRESDDAYRVVWSKVRGDAPEHTNDSIEEIRDAVLPIMSDGEVGILVEGARDYVPPLLGSGIDPFRIRDVMIVRPRFAPTLCWSDSDSGPWTVHDQVC